MKSFPLACLLTWWAVILPYLSYDFPAPPGVWSLLAPEPSDAVCVLCGSCEHQEWRHLQPTSLWIRHILNPLAPRKFCMKLSISNGQANFSNGWPRYLMWNCPQVIVTEPQSLMTSQHWFKQWLGAIRQKAITGTKVDPDLCRHMASLGHNELKKMNKQINSGVSQLWPK